MTTVGKHMGLKSRLWEPVCPVTWLKCTQQGVTADKSFSFNTIPSSNCKVHLMPCHYWLFLEAVGQKPPKQVAKANVCALFVRLFSVLCVMFRFPHTQILRNKTYWRQATYCLHIIFIHSWWRARIFKAAFYWTMNINRCEIVRLDKGRYQGL